MKVENSLYPSKEQMAGFAEPGPQGAIGMVNLLRFRDKAEYEDGRASELSGREAYAIYAAGVAQLIRKFGGKLLYGGDVERLMVGEVEDLWDMVAIASYPSRQAMHDMLMSEQYQEISPHRSAGLAGQLNIETVNASGALSKTG